MRTHLIVPYILCALLLVLGIAFHNGVAFGLGLIGTAAYGSYILRGQPKVQYCPVPVQARPLTPSQPHVATARPLSPGEPYVAVARPLEAPETIHRPSPGRSRKPPRNGRFDA